MTDISPAKEILPGTPRTPRRARSGRSSLSRWGHYLFIAPAIIYVALTVLYPVLYNIRSSFFDIGIAQVVGSAEADWVGFGNYVAAFQERDFWFALLISATYTGLAVVSAVVLGTLLATLFNRGFPGAGYMRGILLVAWILPTVVSANVWRWIFDGSFGLLNAGLRGAGLLEGDFYWLGKADTALLALVLATVWTQIPFAMVLITAGLQSIPSSIFEAARVDGASRVQQFFYLTIPSLKPVLRTTALLCFIYTFVSFDMVFLMTSGGPGNATRTLTVYAYQEAFSFFRFGDAAVATTVLLVIPALLAVWYFRSLRKEESA